MGFARAFTMGFSGIFTRALQSNSLEEICRSFVKALLVKHPHICRKKMEICICVYVCGRLEFSLEPSSDPIQVKALLVKAPLAKGFYKASRAFTRAPLVKHPCICRKKKQNVHMCICMRQARGCTRGFIRAFAKALSSEELSCECPSSKGLLEST